MTFCYSAAINNIENEPFNSQQLITSRNEVEELKKKLEQEKIDRKVEKQLVQEREKGEKSEAAEKDTTVGI